MDWRANLLSLPPTVVQHPLRLEFPGVVLGRPGHSRYLIPTHLHQFYNSSSHLDYMNDRAVTPLWEVGRLARVAVEAGIDQERQEGKHMTIGKPVDVVAVTLPFLV